MTATAIRHHPWVGDLFNASSRRLMILGESHHGDDPEATDVTVGVVEKWLSGVSGATYKFFTNLAVAISGEEPSRLKRKRTEVFRQIMFYNYLLAIMSGPRVKPTSENFAEIRTGVPGGNRTVSAHSCSRVWPAIVEQLTVF